MIVAEYTSMAAAGQIGDLSGGKASHTGCQQVVCADPGKQALERASLAANMLSVQLTAQLLMSGCTGMEGRTVPLRKCNAADPSPSRQQEKQNDQCKGRHCDRHIQVQ